MTPLIPLSFVAAILGRLLLAQAVARECDDALLTPIPLHTLEQRPRHRCLFPQYPFRHRDLLKSPHAAALNTACLDMVPQDLGDQACGPLLASQTALNLLDQVSGEPHVRLGLEEGRAC